MVVVVVVVAVVVVAAAGVVVVVVVVVAAAMVAMMVAVMTAVMVMVVMVATGGDWWRWWWVVISAAPVSEPRNLHFKAHKGLSCHEICTSRPTKDCPATKSALQGPLSAAPATKSALQLSRSTKYHPCHEMDGASLAHIRFASPAHTALFNTFNSPAHTGFAQLRTHRLHSSLNSTCYLKLICAHRLRSPARTQIES